MCLASARLQLGINTSFGQWRNIKHHEAVVAQNKIKQCCCALCFLCNAMTQDNTHTAKLFRHTRTHLRLSVRQLAAKLKLAAPTLNRIESGHYAPSAEVVEQLVALSGTESLVELFIRVYR